MPESVPPFSANAAQVLAIFANARAEGREIPADELDRIERHQMEDVWLTVQDDPWWEPS
jgi:hypothetical protein